MKRARKESPWQTGLPRAGRAISSGWYSVRPSKSRVDGRGRALPDRVRRVRAQHHRAESGDAPRFQNVATPSQIAPDDRVDRRGTRAARKNVERSAIHEHAISYRP